MGYKIIYDHQNKHGFYKKRSYPKIHKIAAVIIIVAILVSTQIKPLHNKIKQYILPDEWMVTEAALDTMIQQVENGESFYDAAAAFCQEIINAGKED